MAIKKTPPSVSVDSIRHQDKRANIPTNELIVTMLYLFDINKNSMVFRVD